MQGLYSYNRLWLFIKPDAELEFCESKIRHMNHFQISRYKRPVTSIVLSLIIVLFGFVGFSSPWDPALPGH